MLLLTTLLLLVGSFAIEYRPPRDNQFQIQGIQIEERPLERTKRQGFGQQRFVQNGQQNYILPSQYVQQQQLQQLQQQQRGLPFQTFQTRQRVFHDIPGYGEAPNRLGNGFGVVQAKPQQVPQQAPQIAPQQPPQLAPQPYPNAVRPQPQQQAHVDYNGARYYYPPRQPFPLSKCFYNPSGYACCNQHLNDVIVETYTEMDRSHKHHTCNVNALATQIQKRVERRFNTTFETIAAYDDFAQKIHFNGDLVCKVEMGGKYMLAYATVKDVSDNFLRPLPGQQGPANFLHSHVKNHFMKL